MVHRLLCHPTLGSRAMKKKRRGLWSRPSAEAAVDEKQDAFAMADLRDDEFCNNVVSIRLGCVVMWSACFSSV